MGQHGRLKSLYCLFSVTISSLVFSYLLLSVSDKETAQTWYQTSLTRLPSALKDVPGPERVKATSGLSWVKTIRAFSEDLEPHAQEHTCKHSLPPQVDTVNWDSQLWQEVRYDNVFLLSAFYDDRYKFRGQHFHYVRLISSVRDTLDARLTCYLWPAVNGSISGPISGPWDADDPFNLTIRETNLRRQVDQLAKALMTGHHSPTVVKARPLELWTNFWPKGSSVTLYKTYLLSCPVPRHLYHKISAISVSSSDKTCDKKLGTLLPVSHVIDDRVTRDQKDFAVCVKGLDYENDISDKLVEWIELLTILGADKISFYILNVHPRVREILRHYQAKGTVSVSPLTLPGQLPNDPLERRHFLGDNLWQKRRLELVPYNDCFYRHMRTHRYVVNLDIDEVIVPKVHSNWSQLLDAIFELDPSARDRYASFSVQNVYFFDHYGRAANKSNMASRRKFHMLLHNVKSSNYSRPGFAVKSFISTNQTLSVFNHYALNPIKSTMARNALISTQLAQLNHYRSKCPSTMSKDCSDNYVKHYQVDHSLDRFEEQLVNRVRRAWTQMRSKG
ncbi:hypothetical protein HDE_12250 [Halotydeus destructor]|nr:hypothetical protein HDE_12250 [Halotydeus destructor]